MQNFCSLIFLSTYFFLNLYRWNNVYSQLPGPKCNFRKLHSGLQKYMLHSLYILSKVQMSKISPSSVITPSLQVQHLPVNSFRRLSLHCHTAALQCINRWNEKVLWIITVFLFDVLQQFIKCRFWKCSILHCQSKSTKGLKAFCGWFL